MSVKVMSKVWEVTEQKANKLLLLLALADNANDDNLVLACRRCNNQKRTQSYEEFAYAAAINAVQL